MTIQPLLDAMEQVHHHGRAQTRRLQQARHIKTKGLGRQVEQIVGMIKQPAKLSLADPSGQPRGEIARLRPARTGQQFAKMG